MDRRQRHGADVGDSRRWPSRYGRDTLAAIACRVGRRHDLPQPTEAPIPDGVVVIENGRISAVGQTDTMRVPDGVATLECSGSTIAAGFWNSHVHFFENQWADAANISTPRLADQLRTMLTRYGFTSVFDLSSVRGCVLRLECRASGPG